MSEDAIVFQDRLTAEFQFWEIVALLLLSSAAMFIWFRRSGWL